MKKILRFCKLTLTLSLLTIGASVLADEHQPLWNSLAHITPMGEKQITIIVPSYNNKEWFQKNLDSIFMQNYSNYKVMYIDDVSTDGTADLVQAYAAAKQQSHRVTIVRNKERVGGLANIYNAVHQSPDHMIMVELDGDDWFAHPNVLSLLNKVYEDNNVWMTYGQYQDFPSGKMGNAKQVPAHIIAQNRFRGQGWEHPLRSFYAWLFKKIDPKDLMQNGKFFMTSWDHAFMLPMHEMAGGRFKFIPDVLYIYNHANQLGDDKLRANEQMRVARIIHSMPAYKKINAAPSGIQEQVRAYVLAQSTPDTLDPLDRSVPAVQKKAIISGITGQDGSYLAEFLLEKGYEVHGIKRRASSFNSQRVDHLYRDKHERNLKFFLHYGDMTDSSLITRLVQEVQPDEIYNLAAQSHVQVSFELPEYTAQVDAIGTLNFLEAIRILGLEKKTRFYQASTSELYGKIQAPLQDETTPFYPRSPYSVAKLYAYWITVNYREAYNIFACNGILFNHESPRRGETFVTRKITRAIASIKLGLQDCLYLGNLDARRDWGYAKDYVEAMWLMLQHDTPRDFVIATAENHSVREFVEKGFNEIGVQITWSGHGIDEIGIDKASGKILVRIDPRYFRPTEVDVLLGNPAQAKKLLGWSPKTSFDELVRIMIESDLKVIAQEHCATPGVTL